jgi:hypothetical protein
MELTGRYKIDGKDLWTVYNMIVESGSDSFLKYPSKKESITHDWLDSNGLDVDLSRIFFNARDLVLNAAIIADSTEQFWLVYESFIAHMAQPELRRIEVGEFGDRSFYAYYKECNNFQRFTRVKVADGEKVACKFTIVFTETNPSLNSQNTYIVDDAGRFIIT